MIDEKIVNAFAQGIVVGFVWGVVLSAVVRLGERVKAVEGKNG